jgi:hypothetical protein
MEVWMNDGSLLLSASIVPSNDGWPIIPIAAEMNGQICDENAEHNIQSNGGLKHKKV